jgi:hypothetical protein
MTLAFSRFDDSNSVNLKLGIMIDIPLILNFNYQPEFVGKGSSRFGYFVGGGFGSHSNHYTAANDDGTITQQISGYRPVANAGIRFSIIRRRVHTSGIHISYMKMLNAGHTDIFGVGCQFNF